MWDCFMALGKASLQLSREFGASCGRLALRREGKSRRRLFKRLRNGFYKFCCYRVGNIVPEACRHRFFCSLRFLEPASAKRNRMGTWWKRNPLQGWRLSECVRLRAFLAPMSGNEVSDTQPPMRRALCTSRSKMPSANVGSPICSCHFGDRGQEIGEIGVKDLNSQTIK